MNAAYQFGQVWIILAQDRFAADLVKCGKRFPFGESERIFRIARLFDKAVNVFGKEDLARKWLKEPAWVLGDVEPIEYARTELGAHEVESLLGRIEDGVFA